MKNSPHHADHLRKKAVRGLSQETTMKTTKARSKKAARLQGGEGVLSKDDTRNKRILEAYKKNLEYAEYSKVHHSNRFSMSQLDANRPHMPIDRTDQKALKNWKSHDLAKSSQLARQVLKRQNLQHRRAA